MKRSAVKTKILKKRRVFTGKLLKLDVCRVKLPHGRTTELEVIQHPGAALIIPFLTARTIIFLKQFRPVINAFMYELPAGTLEKGESARACARREIVEETGFRARRFTRLGVIYPVPGYSTERIVIYEAHTLSRKTAACDDDEIFEQVPLTKNKVKTLFRAGHIVDAKTIAALAFCGWLR